MSATPVPSLARRRRAVAVLAVVATVLLGRAWASGSHAASERPVREQMVPASQRVYVVQPGDTLWRIARAVEPRGDVRPVVDRLSQGRRGRPLRVGERVVLP